MPKQIATSSVSEIFQESNKARMPYILSDFKDLDMQALRHRPDIRLRLSVRGVLTLNKMYTIAHRQYCFYICFAFYDEMIMCYSLHHNNRGDYDKCSDDNRTNYHAASYDNNCWGNDNVDNYNTKLVKLYAVLPEC